MALPTTWPASEPPCEWIDADTGHRVRRLTNEPGSGGLYFNFDAYTPDSKAMAYSSPDGIRLLQLNTLESKLIAPGKVRFVGMGRKSRSMYYIDVTANAVFVVNVDTLERRKVVDIPRRSNIVTINADDTLLAGTYIEGDAGDDYGAKKVMPQGLVGPNVQPMNKAQMMEDRFNARLPLVLFTVNVATGEIKTVMHSNDWVNHLLFSPSDPGLLMYCHEGPWHKVDRIWHVRVDGGKPEPKKLHTRTMAMEIWGHEFWNHDGSKVWYDLQLPKGEDFFLASYDMKTQERVWYHLLRDEWSIHFNVTRDGSLLCGDGGDTGQVARAKDGKWIYLFHPERIEVKGTNEPGFIQPGVLKSERLVNMANHHYKMEPNVRFSPDGKQVFFTADILGPSYLFAVDVEKVK
ncbi:MAG: oligogalacturonate lyase family protein [Tepidisphaeraceae bacterium]